MNDVERYINGFPANVQEILFEIRKRIFDEISDATEKIGYGMPGIYFKGKPLVYYGAFKNHIGFYATPAGQNAFSEELWAYKQGKGSVQFPLNKEIPYDLIVRMSKFKRGLIK